MTICNLYIGAKSEGRAIVSVKVGDNVGVAMIRDLRGLTEREGAQIGVFLTLAEPSRPIVSEAAGAGLCDIAGFASVPRIQIVTIEQAMALRERAVEMALRERAVEMPARRDDTFKKAQREEKRGAQGKMNL